MGIFFDTYIHPIVRWQGFLQPDSNPEANDGGKGTVSDGWRDLHQDADESVRVRVRSLRCWTSYVDIWEVDHGKLAQGQRVLRVRNCRYQIYETSVV